LLNEEESQPPIDFSRDKKSEILLGAHMAIKRAYSINCTAFCHVERSRDISNFSPSIRTEAH
jgi:hypothetical protein